MAFEYINKGLRISKVASILNISSSSFYRNKPADNNNKPVKRKRENSEFALRKDENNTVVIDNSTVVNNIKKLLSVNLYAMDIRKQQNTLTGMDT